jgi:hypothetical protein
MTPVNERQGCDFVPGRGLCFVAVTALLCAILSLSAISSARAQAVTTAPADHTTLTSAEAQRALDVLQDAAKRDELIETLRSIVKVSSVAPTQPTPPGVDSGAAADGFGADALLQASTNIGELSAQFEQSVRAATKFPLLWRWLTNTATDPQAQQLLLSLLWRAAAVALLRCWRNALSSLLCVGLGQRWMRARRATPFRPGPSSLSAPMRLKPCDSVARKGRE